MSLLSYHDANARDRAWHQNPTADIRKGGLCQKVSRLSINAGPFGDSALLAWLNTPAAWKVAGKAIDGGLGYFDDPRRSGEFGHAVRVVEKSYCWSTDILAYGHLDKVPISYITQHWGLRFLGTIVQVKEGKIPLAPAAPKPPVVVSAWAHGDVYRSKLHYGQVNSDSVKRLQYRLNHVYGYIHLNVTGTYDSYTDACVRGWQKRAGYTPDAAFKSFLGPQQTVKMFPAPYVIH